MELKAQPKDTITSILLLANYAYLKTHMNTLSPMPALSNQ
jgi:hypothetical protein